jgi:hypothetical protein
MVERVNSSMIIFDILRIVRTIVNATVYPYPAHQLKKDS